MLKLNRRNFIKLAAATGSIAIGARIFPAAAQITCTDCHRPTIPEGVVTHRWVPTCCMMCGGQTGILCNIIDERVVKIEPNPDNPIGFSNISSDYFEHKKQGAVMCPKGNAGIMTLYDPDRLKKPLKRTNPTKGPGVDPKWVEITYEEAINEIAGKIKALRDAGEAHKLIWFQEDASFVNIAQDFCNLYGTPNFHIHSNLCDVSRKASFKLVMGDERPLADFVQTKYMLIFGWNPLSATKWAHLPRIITRGIIENGAKFVVVDPYSSFTVSKAHEWIPIRPGTDGAMALAMGHVIVKEKLYDEKFIEEWTVGFDKYAEYVKDKTPEWAEDITSVPADTIRRIAREFATTKPAVVDVWSGPGQQSNAVQSGRAIALLAVLTGNVDKHGTLINPVRKGGKRRPLKFDKSPYPRLDGLGVKYPFAHSSGIDCEAINRMADEKGPYQPKIGFFVFANRVLSVPGTKNVIEAIKKLEYVVVIDTHMSETAELADIVLPGTTYLERYEIIANWVTWPATSLRQPVVKPIFNQMPEYNVIMALGQKLGLKDKDGKGFEMTYEEYINDELNGAFGLTLEEFKRLPGATWVDSKGTEYEKFKKEVKVPEGATTDEKTGVVKDKDGKPIGVKIGDKVYQGFNTPSRKLEFYSEQVIGKKDANGNPIDPLPVYTPRDWLPDEKYPLYLINWKEMWHTQTRTHNNPWLMELQGRNPLYINAETANKLGIKNEDEVWIESPYSKDKAIAKVVQGIHPDVVGLQHGFGHWALGRVAKGKGTGDGQFIPTKADPISGQALHKECCVKVYKA